MRRRTVAVLLPVVTLAVLVFTGGPANAQAGYPPALCASTPIVNLGDLPIGSSVSIRVGGPWVPGSIVNFVFDGQPAGQKTVDSDGCITVNIIVNSVNAVDVDDILPGRCGANTLRITGVPANAQAASTVLINFNIVCNQQFNPGNPGAVGGAGVGGATFTPFIGGSSLQLPLLQQPLLASYPQQQQQQAAAPAAGSSAPAAAPPAAAAAPAAGKPAFTGANVLRWLGAALVLMALGLALILNARFRTRARSAEF